MNSRREETAKSQSHTALQRKGAEPTGLCVHEWSWCVVWRTALSTVGMVILVHGLVASTEHRALLEYAGS